MEKQNKELKGMVYMLMACLLVISVLFTVVAVDQENRIKDLETDRQLLIEIGSQKQSTIDSLRLELDGLHTMSWETIEYWVDTLGIEYSEVVMQQISLETGQLTSTICNENNNLFGMKEPRVRETTALGTKRGHAYYGNYIDSIKDYKLWQEYSYDGGNYYSFLSNVGYAEATHYISALKNI